ncbi:MAG: type III CRISPR-associated RAMP protein Csx7 [Blastocatellia bacterium]
MLKQLLNECIIELTISPDGPILIKSGMAAISGPDMTFVTTKRNEQDEVYLPGSSLKGVLRSHAERIARTLNERATCDPFTTEYNAEAFCGNVFEARKKKEKNIWPKLDERDRLNRMIYKESCPICRLFGSTWYAGRLATEDAYAVEKAPRPQQRDGVGIDRFTGGAASGVKFDMEVVTGGTFATRLHLRNFELWQLGLLGFLLMDLKDGLVRVGAAKSRGLGKVKAAVQSVRLDFLGPKSPEPAEEMLTLKGVGELSSEQVAGDYDMARPDVVLIPVKDPDSANRLRATYLFSDDEFPWDAIAQRWVEKATGYQTPEAMVPYRRTGGRHG